MMRYFVMAMVLGVLVGCAPAEIKTSTPPAEPSVSASAAAADQLATGTGEPRKITIEDFKATQSAAIESNQATQAAITPTPTSATVSEVEPTIIDTAAADILNAGVLPDGAVAQIPAVGYLSAGELAALGDQYAVISDGRSLRVYDVAGGSLLWAVRFGDDAVVKHSPDERWIVATIGDMHYVWEAANGSLKHTFQGTDWDAITSWSTDSKLLIARGVISNFYEEGNLVLVNPETGEDVYAITDQKMAIGHVLWTRDGRYLITSNYDHGQILNEIVVRDAATGERLREMAWESGGTGAGNEPIRRSVANLYFNADETMLLATYGHRGADTLSVPGMASLWDIESGQEVRRFEYEGVWDARFSPDGTKIAAMSMINHDFGEDTTGSLPIWDAASGELVHEIEFPVPSDTWWEITDGAWSPNGAVIAVVMNGRIMVFDALRGEYLRTLDGTADRVEWSADGEKVRSSVHEWNLVTGEIRRLDGAPITGIGELRDVVWLPDGSGVVIAGRDAVQVWEVDRATGLTYYLRSMRLAELTVPMPPFEGIKAIAVSPDGSTLATIHPGTIALWDVQSGSLRRILVQADEGIAVYDYPHYSDVEWSPDGKWIAIAGETTQVLDAASGQVVHELGTRRYVDLEFLPNSEVLAGAYEGVTVWRVDTGEQLMQNHNLAESFAIAWSPDGMSLAVSRGGSIASSNRITILSISTLTSEITEQDYPPFVRDIAWLGDRYLVVAGGYSEFEPTGNQFLTGSYDSALSVWDAQSGAVIRTLYGHTAEIEAVGVSPDGTLFATASADGTVLIWDVP